MIIGPIHAYVGDKYICEKLQALKVTEKVKKLKVKPFEVLWQKDTINIINGPIFNRYDYKIIYSSKNSFTASNNTLAAVIRFSESQKSAYLSFVFSTPFSVTITLAECGKFK